MAAPANRLSDSDKQNAEIYLETLDKLHALPSEKSVPSLALRWLCHRYGIEGVMGSLAKGQAEQISRAAFGEVYFCISWMADMMLRHPPPPDKAAEVWDDIKTMHLSTYNPAAVTRLLAILNRHALRERGKTASKTRH
jgi:hypothetical protein